MKKRILFVHNNPTRFVQIDKALLQQRWVVQEWYQQRPAVNLLALLGAVRGCGLVFCWFASWHALAPVLLARLLRKPVVVVIGGYDTANLPEAGYGSQRGGLRRLIARTVIQNATHLITNSYSARAEAIANAQADPHKIKVIYHGLPAITPGCLEERENIVLTVGNLWRENLLRKGFLPFVQAAAYLPEFQFVHVGRWYDDSIETLRQATANVEFKGFLPEVELVELYRRSSVYVQASLHEGFGLSVAEAMLGGCIPVVTRCGSLPEVVGETGIYSDSNRPEDIAAAVRQAGRLDGVARQRAHDRIKQQFPIELRGQALEALLGEVIEEAN